MTAEIQIVNVGSGLALDTRHAIRARARVQMFDRNDPPNRNQVWALDSAGRLRCGGPDSDLVLDDVDGELRLAPVDTMRRSQQWDHVDGRLVNRSAAGTALSPVPPVGRESRLRMADAGHGSEQSWHLVPITDPSVIVEPGPWDGDVDD